MLVCAMYSNIIQFFNLDKSLLLRQIPVQIRGLVAQLVEQWTLNPAVVGSIPTGPTTEVLVRFAVSYVGLDLSWLPFPIS